MEVYKTKQMRPGIPDSKVHGANMGPIWGRQDPGGFHVGPMNLAIWDGYSTANFSRILSNAKYNTLQRHTVYLQKTIYIAHLWGQGMGYCLSIKIWSVPYTDHCDAACKFMFQESEPWFNMLCGHSNWPSLTGFLQRGRFGISHNSTSWDRYMHGMNWYHASLRLCYAGLFCCSLLNCFWNTFLVQTFDELSCYRHTQAGNDNIWRPKLALGKNVILECNQCIRQYY